MYANIPDLILPLICLCCVLLIALRSHLCGAIPTDFLITVECCAKCCSQPTKSCHNYQNSVGIGFTYKIQRMCAMVSKNLICCVGSGA